jgi:hypothetical protein
MIRALTLVEAQAFRPAKKRARVIRALARVAASRRRETLDDMLQESLRMGTRFARGLLWRG